MSRLPEHLPNGVSREAAIAPYNFVELPDEVVSTEEQTPVTHDRYHDGRHTGRIECTLTTSSPLYVRCALTTDQFAEGERQRQNPPDDYREAIKNTPDFFYTHDKEQPVIPGSSLRGMLRTLVEIVSFGKMTQVTDQQRYFFRAVAAKKDDPLAFPYKSKLRNVRAGYLIEKSDGWYIQPVEPINSDTFIKVRAKDIPHSLDVVHLHDPLYCPQYVAVSFTIKQTPRGRIVIDEIDIPGVLKYEGQLVTSGNMNETGKPGSRSPRKNHCVVPIRSPNAQPLKIDDNAITDYRNGLTDFQKEDPPFDKQLGMLEHNRPVFYCEPPKGNPVTFFGQSPNFRIPYRFTGGERAASPYDFVPAELKQDDIVDLAEAIFGYVRREKQQEGQVRAGRVFVGDATLNQGQSNVWLRNEPITPRILSGPKPTTFQHYLVQPTDDRANLMHYASKPEDDTVIRGHKLYWHQGVVGKDDIEDTSTGGDTQRTQFKPINAGVSFTFTIRFENLSDVELGALLWVLRVAADDSYRLKLGMGKPLGMGAVKIEHLLHLTDRVKRYTTLFNETGNQWEYGTKDTGSTAETEKKTLAAFERAILRNEVINPPKGKTRTYQRIAHIPRIQSLLRMLYWKDELEDNEKGARKYMELDDFRSRPVLPTPEGVASNSDDVLPDPTADVLGDMDLLEEMLIAPVSKPVETRRLGIIARVATPSESGLLEDENKKEIPYGHNDIIGIAPVHQQKVLFRETRKKQGRRRKYGPWAEDVEGQP